MEKAKIREADIVIWGWYKKSRTSVVISSHIDLIRTFENRILKHRDDIAVQTVPDFDNFTPQLEPIEGVSFYRGGTSRLLYAESENFDERFLFCQKRSPWPPRFLTS